MEVSGLVPDWSTKTLHSTEKKEKERNRKKKGKIKSNIQTKNGHTKP